MKVERYWRRFLTKVVVDFEDGHTCLFEPLYDVVSMQSEELERWYLYTNHHLYHRVFLWRGLHAASIQSKRQEMYVEECDAEYSLERIAAYWQSAIDHITNEWLTYERDEDWYAYILVTKSKIHLDMLRTEVLWSKNA